jgi:hypothetical protein
MDRLSVNTQANVDGSFSVLWNWSVDAATVRRQPNRGGTIRVTLDEKHQEDRSILAELAALHHLLEVRQIHGENRLGVNLTIEVSAGAIKKALAKGALKKDGKGGTSKKHVADCAEFLATKYFEANIETGKWRDEEPKVVKNHDVHLGDYPSAPIYASILGENVIVTRHAMFRTVGRIIERKDSKEADDLSDVPTERWSSAWGWFQNIFREGSNLQLASIVPREWKRIVGEYKCKPIILYFPDARAIPVLKRTPYGIKVVTVLRDSEYNRILEKPPVQAGQVLRRQ